VGRCTPDLGNQIMYSKEYGHITSVKAMKQAVISIWNEFEDYSWDHLVESMLNRIQAVIRAKGGS
jgi:hypothetical protein